MYWQRVNSSLVVVTIIRKFAIIFQKKKQRYVRIGENEAACQRALAEFSALEENSTWEYDQLLVVVRRKNVLQLPNNYISYSRSQRKIFICEDVSAWKVRDLKINQFYRNQNLNFLNSNPESLTAIQRQNIHRIFGIIFPFSSDWCLQVSFQLRNHPKVAVDEWAETHRRCIFLINFDFMYSIIRKM